MLIRIVSTSALALWVVCLLVLTPTQIIAQDDEEASLHKRITILEQRIAQLERTIAELRKAQPSISSIPKDTQPGERKNWQLVQLGMSMEEVERLLSKPRRTSQGAFTTWYYQPGFVIFHEEKVTRFSAP